MQGLRVHADDPQLQAKWRAVKAQAKERAAAKIQQLTGVKVNPNALFDIQVCKQGSAGSTELCWIHAWLLQSSGV